MMLNNEFSPECFLFNRFSEIKGNKRVSLSNIRLRGKRNNVLKKNLEPEEMKLLPFRCSKLDAARLGNDNKSFRRHYNRNLVSNDVNKNFTLMSGATTNSIFQ